MPEEGGDAELAHARAALFGLLARVFGARPTAELIEAMQRPEMRESLEVFGVMPDAGFPAQPETDADWLAQEYTRLFVGPGHIAAYESVYVPADGEEPRLWGKATAEVANFFEEIGLKVAGAKAPDHLSVEMQAMASLALAEARKLEDEDAKAAGKLREKQDLFCREHLLRWVPAVCADVERETASSFYRGMAALASGLVRMSCGSEWSGNLQKEERGLNEIT